MSDLQQLERLVDEFETSGDISRVSPTLELIARIHQQAPDAVTAHATAKAIARFVAMLAVVADPLEPAAAVGLAGSPTSGPCCCCKAPCCCQATRADTGNATATMSTPLAAGLLAGGFTPIFGTTAVASLAGAGAIPVPGGVPLPLPDLADILRKLGLTPANIRLILQRAAAALAGPLAAAGGMVGGAVAAAWPFLLAALLASLMWLLLFWVIAQSAALPVALGDVLAAQRWVEEQLDRIRAAEIEALIARYPASAEALRRCWADFLEAIEEGYRYLAMAWEGMSVEQIRHRLYQFLLDAIEELCDCLERLGVPNIDTLWRMDLARDVGRRFGFTGLIVVGPILPIDWVLKRRNPLRERALDGLLSRDLHRRGGFGFTEFPDDRDSLPDLDAEDPDQRVPVVPEDIEEGSDEEIILLDVDQGLSLDEFSDEHLEMRKNTLRKLINSLLTLIAEQDAEIERLGNSAAEEDARLRLQTARHETVKELRRLKSALRNALIECLIRARGRGQEAQARDLEADIKAIDIYDP